MPQKDVVAIQAKLRDFIPHYGSYWKFFFVQSHLHLDAAGDRHLSVGQPGLLHRPHPGRDLGFKRRRCGEQLLVEANLT